jgi:hypothetical protein
MSDAMTTAHPIYPVRPYRPDRISPPAGMLMLLCAMLIAGGILGFLVHIIRQYFYLIGVFPVLIGLVMGAVGVFMVKAGRIRNPWVAGIAAFFGGVAAMTLMHHFDYESLQKNLASVPPQMKMLAAMNPQQRQAALATSDLTSAERRELEEEFLPMLRIGNFFDYLNYRAHVGVSLKKAGRSGGGMNLGYTGTWIYWIIELLIVAGIALVMVRSSAAEPFCAPCDKWKETRKLGFLGNDPTTATSAINSGNLNTIQASSPGQIGTPLQVSAACCGNCGDAGEIDVKLQHVTLDKEGKLQEKTLTHVTYPATALPALESLFNPSVQTIPASTASP